MFTISRKNSAFDGRVSADYLATCGICIPHQPDLVSRENIGTPRLLSARSFRNCFRYEHNSYDVGLMCVESHASSSAFPDYNCNCVNRSDLASRCAVLLQFLDPGNVEINVIDEHTRQDHLSTSFIAREPFRFREKDQPKPFSGMISI